MLRLKKTKNKEPTSYKSLYIKNKLVKEIEKIDTENNTSYYINDRTMPKREVIF